MNLLAHIFLSYTDEDLLIGNFITDYLSLEESRAYPPSVQRGIRLHRQIDQFMDGHPQVRKGRARLRDYYGKYAPVVIDLYYDYLLAVSWSGYSSEVLEDFSQKVYRIFEKKWTYMPERLRLILPGMMEHDWLSKYGTEYGILRAFGSLKSRASRPELLDQPLKGLMENYGLFEEEFNLFFPEIIEESRINK